MNYCNKGILLFYKPKCLLFIVLIISVLQKNELSEYSSEK